MGAHDISFELDGKATRGDVEKAFKAKRGEDAEYNGHREGYSGDFQTVNRVDFHDKIFDSEHEAMEYCLNKAEKWTSVVAVKYKVYGEVKTDAKCRRLLAKIQKIEAKRKALAETAKPIREAIFTAIKAKPFHTCRHCKSRISVTYFTRPYCTVCNTDVIPVGLAKRFEKLNLNLKQAIDERDAYRSALLAKRQAVGTRWLIAGWGAC